MRYGCNGYRRQKWTQHHFKILDETVYISQSITFHIAFEKSYESSYSPVI